MPEGYKNVYDGSKEYVRYAEDVLGGRQVACNNVILACKRFKEWFARDDMYFDYAEVDRRIRVVGKMKHFKGKSNGKPFILLPYQQFIFANIFGWKWCDSHLRVTKNVLLFMGRKNGKTSLASSICISQLLLDNNNGQEVDFIASSGSQARLGFDMTKNYCQSLDPNGLIFTRFRDIIKMPSTKSEINVRNSDAMTLDGLNSSTFIADEAHSYKNWDLWNVLKSSQGFQQQPLAIMITTAGFLLDGFPLYEWRKTCIEILKGVKEDDSQFSMLFELDEGDEWDDESKWIKANPSLGVTVTLEYLRDECRAAQNQPSLEFGFKTKLLNMFCQSSDVWISNEYLRNVMQPIEFEQLRGEYCWSGVDLSAVSDLTCVSWCFPPNESRELFPDKYIFKTKIYIPESALKESVNKSIYKNWFSRGDAEKTSGNIVDFSRILEEELLVQNEYNINYVTIGYDAWNSAGWAVDATNKGLPIAPFSQNVGNFNRGTKYFEQLVRSGRCVIDENSAVLWCMNNVRLMIDRNENCKPGKSTAEAKIDPAISMIEALGSYLLEAAVDVEIV